MTGTVRFRRRRRQPVRVLRADHHSAAHRRHRGERLAMVYSVSHGTYPTFLLNAILLPLNAVRLRAMGHLVQEVDAARPKTTSTSNGCARTCGRKNLRPANS